MIDYILVNRRWKNSISICRSFSKPDVASDHQLVMAGVKIKLKTMHREAPVKRFDTEKLKDDITQQRYYGVLQENWRKAADSQMETVEEVWKEIRQVYNAAAQEVLGYTKRQKKTPWISQEVLELSDRRKQLKAGKSLSKENKTN
jgi:hypothetical protein